MPGPSRPPAQLASRSHPRRAPQGRWSARRDIAEESCCSIEQGLPLVTQGQGRPILIGNKWWVQEESRVEKKDTSSFDGLPVVDHRVGGGAGRGVSHDHGQHLLHDVWSRVWHLVSRLLGIETFLILLRVSVSVSKVWSQKKVSVSVSKNFSLKNKSQYWSQKYLVSKKVSVSVSKILVSKSLSIGLKRFGLKKVLTLV